MATMIPDRLDAAVESAAERKIFERIRNELGSEWIALHSLGLAVHPTLPWAEIDFVLIGPPGVFCLEVKGGRVVFKDGYWHFINRRDEASSRRKGPFEQVGPASSALFNHLHGRLPTLPLLVGYGVVTPDIRFSIVAPDVIPEVVYDDDDAERSFAVYLERIAAYWSTRRGREFPLLSPADVTAVRDCLRGDFDLRPSLRARVRHATDELLSLTEQQYTVLDGLADNPRVLINGGAGTGKTLLALEEARRRAERGARVAFFCFNRALAGYLRAATADLPGCDVQHLHGFMAGLVAEAGLAGRIPRGAANAFTEVYPELALEVLLQEERFRSYDMLIVDEAQDLLRSAYLDVFDALVRDGLDDGEWCFFLDPYQNIYDGIQDAALERLQRGRPARFTLRTNCRNTAPVAIGTALLSGIRDTATLRVDGPAIEEQWYRDERHQLRLVSHCLSRLLSDGIAPHDIVILSPRRLERSALRLGLEGVPVSLVDLSEVTGPLPERTVGYSTLHAFKGLESDAVLLVDLDDLGIAGVESGDALPSSSAIYVGASRARAYLAVFIADSQRAAYERRATDYGTALMHGDRG